MDQFGPFQNIQELIENDHEEINNLKYEKLILNQDEVYEGTTKEGRPYGYGRLTFKIS